MSLVPPRPIVEPDPIKRRPLPLGFPPRRIEPPPPLEDKQVRFINGYSLFLENTSLSFRGLTRLLNHLPPYVLFPLQTIWSALLALAMITFSVVFLITRQDKEPFVAGASEPSVWKTFGVIILNLFIGFWLTYILLGHGKNGRRKRWEEYRWESFSQFALIEVWLKVTGVTDYIFMAVLFLVIAYALIKSAF